MTSAFIGFLHKGQKSFTLKNEETRFPGTYIYFYQTTWRHIPEDSLVHRNRPDSPRSSRYL